MSVTLQPLCDCCAKIPFNIEALDKLRRFSLRGGDSLRNNSCPFCRIVLNAFRETQRTVVDKDNMVDSTPLGLEIAWRSTYGSKAGSFWMDAMKDTKICFVRSLSATALIHPGVRLKPTLGPQLDTVQISGWISNCEKNHQKCSYASGTAVTNLFPGRQFLRLVDCKRMCLIQVRGPVKYIALSYVWGAVPNFRLTKQNRKMLLNEGALNKIWRLLPRTIRDAILLVDQLGQRYLWVDALCILQNDAEDLEHGINVMDLIYEHALFTVVAACGHNANAGLPGVQPESRATSNQNIEVVEGVYLGIHIGLDQLLKVSAWDSRAWTFQEHILSRRILYFVDNKVYFRCRQASYSENFFDLPSDSSLEYPEIQWSLSSLLPMTLAMTNPISDFRGMLEYYTERSLTNQDDVFRAMGGIMRRFSELMKCRFFQGLPTAAFDYFICFYCKNLPLRRRKGFPSYSWAGWIGQVTIDLFDLNMTASDWLQSQTWIVWYKRSSSGITNLVWDPEANESFPFNDMSYEGYRERSPFRPPIPLMFPTTRTRPTTDLLFDRPFPPYPMLQFWSLVVYYLISDIDVFRGRGLLLDSAGRKCGTIYMDSFEESDFFNSQSVVELVLLSKWNGIMFKQNWDPIYIPAQAGWWQYYLAMILEWDQGVAERRGIALISLTAITGSYPPGPAWREILIA
ncbi:heterokaryon incompatibility protein-domain-containing protein [Xylogone sp. PMI_703]|nr:heterokaryon incompatibility protein-domain-containing protein [Xylogone sp. PMI_703]